MNNYVQKPGSDGAEEDIYGRKNILRTDLYGGSNQGIDLTEAAVLENPIEECQNEYVAVRAAFSDTCEPYIQFLGEVQEEDLGEYVGVRVKGGWIDDSNPVDNSDLFQLYRWGGKSRTEIPEINNGYEEYLRSQDVIQAGKQLFNSERILEEGLSEEGNRWSEVNSGLSDIEKVEYVL